MKSNEQCRQHCALYIFRDSIMDSYIILHALCRSQCTQRQIKKAGAKVSAQENSLFYSQDSVQSSAREFSDPPRHTAEGPFSRRDAHETLRPPELPCALGTPNRKLISTGVMGLQWRQPPARGGACFPSRPEVPSKHQQDI